MKRRYLLRGIRYSGNVVSYALRNHIGHWVWVDLWEEATLFTNYDDANQKAGQLASKGRHPVEVLELKTLKVINTRGNNLKA